MNKVFSFKYDDGEYDDFELEFPTMDEAITASNDLKEQGYKVSEIQELRF